MKLDEKTLKMILLVASILAMVQGLLTFIGSLVAAEDASRADIDKNNSLRGGKYWCGLVRVKGSGSCDYDEIDRGWFKRVHEGIRDGVSIGNKSPDMDEFKKLVGYGAVISYALIVGLGWISSGGVGLLTLWWSKKMLALVTLGMYGLFYVLHIALFSAIYNSVKKVEDDCRDAFKSACEDLFKLVSRSGKEILGYAICGFITILCSGAGTFLYWYMLPDSPANAVPTLPGPAQEGHLPTTGPLRELPQRPPGNAWDANLDKSKDASSIIITAEPQLQPASQPPKA